jgi:site-specific DNA recombinase
MTACIYCRVSTDVQEKEGSSLSTQQEACLRLAPGAQVLLETFSGLSLERPQLDDLRDQVRSHSLKTVVVYALDRLSRDPVHLLLLMDELERHGVTLKVVTETVDDSDIGKLVTHVRGLAAKLESLKIKERTTRGKRARASSGKIPCGSYLYGYYYDGGKNGSGHRLINEYEAGIVTRIFQNLVNGVSCREICQNLTAEDIPTPRHSSKWGRSTVLRILHNITYTGQTFTYKTIKVKGKPREFRPENEWIEMPDATPPLITAELYAQAQAQLKLNRCTGPSNDHYLLTGFVFCGKCGKRYNGTPSHGIRRYRCSSHGDMTVYCRNKSFKADVLEQDVWAKLIEKLSKPEKLKREYENRTSGKIKTEKLNNEISIRQDRAKKLRENLDRMIKLYSYMETMDLKHGAKEIDRLSRDINNLEKEISLLAGQLDAHRGIQARIDSIVSLSDIVSDLQNADFNDKRKALKHLKVRVTLGEVVSVEMYPAVKMSGTSSSTEQLPSFLFVLK